MAYSSYRRNSRYDSVSPSTRHRSRSRSRSQSPVRNYSDEENAHNPGNNLYITGLSSRVSERDLEDHLSSEGKVMECHLVVDPRTKESRGFGFVTMDSLESAECCIRHLNKSVLEGRVITVEKARRKRARTPTPGRYLGVRASRGTSSYDYERERGYDARRTPQYSPYRTSRDHDPDYSPYRGGGRKRGRSPYASSSRYRDRSRSCSYSPQNTTRSYGGRYRDRSPSPLRSPYKSYSRYRDRSPSPQRFPNKSYSRYRDRSFSPNFYGSRRRYRSRSSSTAHRYVRRSQSSSRSVSPYYRK